MEFRNNFAVDVFTVNGQFVGNWHSLRKAVTDLNINSYGNAYRCVIGNRRSVCGYIIKRNPTDVPIIDGEEWRPVVGFENLYAVSNIGRVASLQYHGVSTFSLMSKIDFNGYPAVKIRNSKTGFVKTIKIHRLVAEAFIPNPENKPHVDHIDTNPQNNNVNNLRWATPSENQRNPITLTRISSHMKKMNKERVGPNAAGEKNRIEVMHTENGNNTVYKSAKAAGIATGHTTSVILRWSRANRHGWSLANKSYSNDIL